MFGCGVIKLPGFVPAFNKPDVPDVVFDKPKLSSVGALTPGVDPAEAVDPVAGYCPAVLEVSAGVD